MLLDDFTLSNTFYIKPFSLKTINNVFHITVSTFSCVQNFISTLFSKNLRYSFGFQCT